MARAKMELQQALARVLPLVRLRELEQQGLLPAPGLSPGAQALLGLPTLAELQQALARVQATKARPAAGR